MKYNFYLFAIITIFILNFTTFTSSIAHKHHILYVSKMLMHLTDFFVLSIINIGISERLVKL